MASITTDLDTIWLISGESDFISSYGWNQFGYPMTFARAWNATGGEIAYGMFTAGDEGGEFLITVSVAEGTVSAQVVVIIEASAGIEKDILLDIEVLIYPNPANWNVSVRAGFIIQIIEVLNLTGQVIDSIHPNSKSAELQLNDKPAGMYFLLIKGANQRFVKQLIVR